MDNRYLIDDVMTDAEPMFSEGDTLAINLKALTQGLTKLLGRAPNEKELQAAAEIIGREAKKKPEFTLANTQALPTVQKVPSNASKLEAKAQELADFEARQEARKAEAEAAEKKARDDAQRKRTEDSLYTYRYDIDLKPYIPKKK